ncbi:MAG: oxygenase MpaB family protein [Polyangiales bacterium]
MTTSFVPLRRRTSDDPYLFPRAAVWTRWCGIDVDHDDPRQHALERATMRADPLADEVAMWMSEQGASGRRVLDDLLENGANRSDCPEPLARLFAAVNEQPAWLDVKRVALGTSTMARQASSGQLALTAFSLLGGYLSSTVTKPLLFTGALETRAPRRLAETSQFVHDIAVSDRLDRWSPGFKTSIRVRLMHATVRRRLLALPTWQLDPWGIPINQRDMIATHLQFTVAYIGGLTMLGALLSPREIDALMHTWRYVSYLLGADDALVPKTFREGLELVEIFNRTEPGPDDGSRRLGVALRAAWEVAPLGQFVTGFARFALGERAAEQLGVPDTHWKLAPLTLAAARLLPELATLGVPGARSRAVRKGKAFLNDRLAELLAGKPASFTA